MAHGVPSNLRFAVRALRTRPAFTAISVLVMAVGIGAVTVMFSALHAVILRPLPFADPDRLVWGWSLTPDGQQNTVAAVEYLDYRGQCRAFESLAAYLAIESTAVLAGDDQPERVRQTLISHNFFSTLGVRPALGRFLLPGDETPGAPDVAVISHALWQRRFGGRASAAGQSLTLDGRVHEIVGVTPAGFDFPNDIELWTPMRQDQRLAQGHGNHNFRMFGRLATGVTIEQAQTQASTVASQIAATYPEDRGWGVRLQPMHEVFFGAFRPAMLALAGAVTLLLLIACANVSSLVLARAVDRRHEIAVRLSLGASRARVVGLLLVEGLVLATLGGGAGLLLSAFGIDAIKALAPATLPRAAEITLDPTVIAVALAASVFSGLLLGIVPALTTGAISLADTLKQGGRATEERAGLRLRSVLVVAQVALSASLLIGSGLLVRSLMRMYAVDPGFRPDALLVTEVQLPTARYARGTDRSVQFVRQARERLTAVPGIVDAAAAELLPFSMSARMNEVYRSDRPPRSPEEQIGALRHVVSSGYFRTLDVPILRGRNFEQGDRRDAPPVTLVNQALADRFWPGEDPLGKHLVLTFGDGIPLEVVGIVGNVRERGPAAAQQLGFYLAYEQFPITNDLKFVIRARAETSAVADQVRAAFHELDPTLALARFETMTSRYSGLVALPRFRTWLLAAFAIVAFALATMGLYGLLACFVSQRTHELGIRMALGADAARVTRLVLRKGMTLAGAGIGLGLAGGVAAARLLQGLLYDTAPLDLQILAAVVVALGAAALAACLIPARRAVRIDPLTALRTP